MFKPELNLSCWQILRGLEFETHANVFRCVSLKQLETVWNGFRAVSNGFQTYFKDKRPWNAFFSLCGGSQIGFGTLDTPRDSDKLCIILGDLGVAGWVDKMFVVKVHCEIETSPWALTLTEPVPEVFELPASDWQEKKFSGQSAKRSSRMTLVFSSSIAIVA